MDTKKLRQKLLDLAIHGKLVPQDPNDEPASELLARIHAEKLAMVERGELKPKDVKNDTVIYFGSDGLPYEKLADGKGEAKCIAGEVPFELPKGWAWTRVCPLVSKLGSGSTPRGGQRVYVASGIPFIRSQNVYNDGLRLEDVAYIDEATNKSKSGSIVCGMDLLLNITGGSIGRCAMVPSDFPVANVNQHVMIIRLIELSLCRFVHAFVTSPFTQALILAKQLGSGRGGLSAETFSTFLIPVPPLAEQRRIVDALDNYLALVDGIERDRADLDGLLAQLKSKVLDLAVRGELVEHDSGDEPASELLARIREEKLAMVGRGELKPKDVKGDTVIFAGSDGLRYEKPADGKGEAKCIEDDKVIPVFAQKCNQPWGITLEKAKFLDESALGKYGEELKLRGGDVVVNSTGTGTLGRVGLFDESILGEYPFIVPDSHVAVVRTLGSVLGEYVFHLLRSEYGQHLIFSKQTGSTNQKELPAKEIAFFLIPVPPLAEQRRIVERTEEVFNLLD